jgi:integrase
MKERELTALILPLSGDSIPEKLLGCPFIARSGYEYDIANACVEDIRLGAFSLPLLQTSLAAVISDSRERAERPAMSSTFQYAYACADVIAWAASLGYQAPISVLNYDEATLIKYEEMMRSGKWSANGKPLSRSTIETRLMMAISMAEWAHLNGLRAETDFTRIAEGAGGYRYALLRPQRTFRILELPSSANMNRFLRATASSRTYFLGAAIASLTALRISELCARNLKDIPIDRLSELDGKAVPVEIIGKGNVLRDVTFDRNLVRHIASYIEHDRPALLEVCARRYGEESEIYKDAEKALLLNEHGRRLAPRSTWAAFRKFGRLAGLKNIHPHLLRHWYAASRLRKAHEKLLRKDPEMSTYELRRELELIIGKIQKELGHASGDTTMIYLESYLDELAQADKEELSDQLWEAMAA